MTFPRRTVVSALAAAPFAASLSWPASAATATSAPKFRGVVYDVGLNFSGTGFSVEPFNPLLVAHDIGVIARDLHATAIRIEGEEIDRLVTASRLAHEAGLAVFFNPWKMNATAEELLPYYAAAATAAEQLRLEGMDIVFVAGCEYPIFNKGIIPGDTLMDRLSGIWAFFGAGEQDSEQTRLWMDQAWERLNGYLKSFVDVIRPKFAGPVSYAATTFEQVDWSLFDIVGVDHYRMAESDEAYVDHLNRYRLDKPLVVMEVGSCAYVGAAALGATGFMVLEGVNPDGTGIFKDGVVPTRSETEQADYVETQVRLLSAAPVDGVFVYVFSFPTYPTGEGAKDLDMASFALVKTFPADDARSRSMPPWAPKEAFQRLAGLFAAMR